jgi:hypothetical protein
MSGTIGIWCPVNLDGLKLESDIRFTEYTACYDIWQLFQKYLSLVPSFGRTFAMGSTQAAPPVRIARFFMVDEVRVARWQNASFGRQRQRGCFNASLR